MRSSKFRRGEPKEDKRPLRRSFFALEEGAWSNARNTLLLRAQILMHDDSSGWAPGKGRVWDQTRAAEFPLLLLLHKLWCGVVFLCRRVGNFTLFLCECSRSAAQETSSVGLPHPSSFLKRQVRPRPGRSPSRSSRPRDLPPPSRSSNAKTRFLLTKARSLFAHRDGQLAELA